MQDETRAERFRLLDHFRLTSLVAFTVVAVSMFFLERAEHQFFTATERQQSAFFGQAQGELLREQKAAARQSLLMEHEAGHIALTTFFANTLWESHFAPLVAEAQKLPLTQCRALALARAASARALAAPSDAHACFAAVGKKIKALPRFAPADAAVHALMKGTTVFKIKVYDLRGLTVYSSEHAQIGEDKAANRGWQLAAEGQPASELVHRDRMSTFEGEVENRDLIQSYVPVLAGKKISGVFEIYSDVTPLLKHLDASSTKLGELAAANQAKVEAASLENRRKVVDNTNLHIVILGLLLAALYAALYLLVRRGQRIIDAQARAREAAALREQAAHREKMAALATMAASASHGIGNPLAIISGLAQDIGRAQAAGEPLASHAEGILAQTSRIAEMTQGITRFASARSQSAGPLDLNEMIRGVREFLSFDTRYRGTRIEATLAEPLPMCTGVPEHLNEVLMNLLQAHAEASLAAPVPGARVRIETEPRGREVAMRIGCESLPSGTPRMDEADPRLDAARRRVEGMGGRLEAGAARIEIVLPCW